MCDRPAIGCKNSCSYQDFNHNIAQKRQSEGLRVNLNNNKPKNNIKNKLINNGHHYHEICLHVTDIKIVVFFRGDEHVHIVGG